MGRKTERFYKIELMIRNRGKVSFDELLHELEVSPATLKRDLQFLRDRMGAPIIYIRDENAYRFGDEHQGDKHELPGMWFDEKELYSLLMAQQLLSGLDTDGILSRHMAPLLDRIHQLLGSNEADSQELLCRIRIVNAAKRPVQSKFFEVIAAAVLQRKQIGLRYFTRSRRSSSDRRVSPQRLTHYRNTWYLDAWCHKSDELRRFALDAMEEVQAQEAPSKDISLKQVEEELDGGYGIFAGNKVRWASLLFNTESAQWVSKEEWHPAQKLQKRPDGYLQMDVPFSDQTELLMDVLRYGPDVEVLSPVDLRHAVAERLTQALGQYASC